jgi:ketosteroid isomerase-like protein
VSDNVEIVRSILRAWNEGDVEHIVASMADDTELVPLRAQLEGTSYRGREGARAFWDDLHAEWADLDLPIDEIDEIGDLVLVLGRLVARGRASGIDIDVPIGQLWRLRDGEVTWMKAYSDPAEARRDSGLDE